MISPIRRLYKSLEQDRRRFQMVASPRTIQVEIARELGHGLVLECQGEYRYITQYGLTHSGKKGTIGGYFLNPKQHQSQYDGEIYYLVDFIWDELIRCRSYS